MFREAEVFFYKEGSPGTCYCQLFKQLFLISVRKNNIIKSTRDPHYKTTYMKYVFKITATPKN